MINIESNSVILLAPFETVKKKFFSELRQRLWDLEKQKTLGRSFRTKNNHVIRFFEDYGSKINEEIDEDLFNDLVVACFSSGHEKSNLTSKEPSDVYIELGKPSSIISYPTRSKEVFTRITKLILLSLWAEELLILPKGVASVKLPNERIYEIAKNTGCEFFYKALAANPLSGLEFSGGVTEDIRKRACNHWLRLIVNTNWTQPENVTDEDIRSLILHYRGSKHSLLARYYVLDFLAYLFEDHPDLKSRYERVHDEISIELKSVKAEKAAASLARRKEYQKSWTPKTKKQTKKEVQVKELLSYYYNGTELEFSELIGTVLTAHSIRSIFYVDKLDENTHALISKMGDKEKKLIFLIDRSFKAFIMSKRVQNQNSYRASLAMLLCYVTVYLPRFFINRDGDVGKFPINFNEFACAYFVARNEYLSEILSNGITAPMTFFEFLDLLGEKFGWKREGATYNHMKNAHRFFEYVESRNKELPDADKFRCVITETDLPATRRRATTTKNVLPREYFQAFLSLLETLEYFVDHINGMADGINPGIRGGLLVYPTYNQLVEQFCWRPIWPSGRVTDFEVDLGLLNYTPIIYFNGKYYPLKRIARFYSLTSYRLNGVDEKRATPHVPRILWLMANTGIRQKHLIWLDKDGFDAAIPHKPTGLAPLIVSTDKAHSEWVSIVSKDVIEVCQRQKEWLERNEIESLKEPIWYSETEKSRFGKFVPLFRLDSASSTWSIHDDVGKIMWTLEKFLRHQVGDKSLPMLAYWRPRNSEKTDGNTTDYLIDIDSFNRDEVDLSWDWNLFTKYTAHGLRAAFVSEHMRFLPPSLIGRHLTGQFSESLVWYYTIMNTEDVGDHQQLLINLLMKNEDAIKNGGAPELAEKITKMNEIIAKDIELDPDHAISAHGLFSLSDVDESKNGIAELRAKRNTKLAFNPTHICPFNNVCPVEVVKNFGLGKPCTLCPYAIRSVTHLPALNAEKFKCVELMEEYGVKIREYRKRPITGVLRAEIEGLEAEYDRLARDAFALEAIEQQLYHIRNQDGQTYVAHDSQTIKDLYENLELGESEHLIKRLIDVQLFPDLDSPRIQQKFARLRYRLMVKRGDISGLLEDHEESANAALSSLLQSMMAAKELTVRDIYKLAANDISSQIDNRPVLQKLGFDTTGLNSDATNEDQS